MPGRHAKPLPGATIGATGALYGERRRRLVDRPAPRQRRVAGSNQRAAARARPGIAAAVCRPVEARGEVVDQVGHVRVAPGGRVAAGHGRDLAAIALHRGHEIEAGGAGEAGLDAVDAVDLAEQGVVVADALAVPNTKLCVEKKNE